MWFLTGTDEDEVGCKVPTLVGGDVLFFAVDTAEIVGPGDNSFAEDDVDAEFLQVLDDCKVTSSLHGRVERDERRTYWRRASRWGRGT